MIFRENMNRQTRTRLPSSSRPIDDKRLAAAGDTAAALRLLKSAVVARHLRNLENAERTKHDDVDEEDDGADLVVVMVDSHASSVSGPDDDVVVMEEEEDEDGGGNAMESSSSGVYSMPSSSATSASKFSHRKLPYKIKISQKEEKPSKLGFVSTLHKLITKKKSRSLPEEEFAKTLIEKHDNIVLVPKVTPEDGTLQKPLLAAAPSTASSKSSVSVLVHSKEVSHPLCETKISNATSTATVLPTSVESSAHDGTEEHSSRLLTPKVSNRSQNSGSEAYAVQRCRQPLLPVNTTPAAMARLILVPPGKKATIWTHYYPEGGWGWVVLVVATLVQMLNHGLQLSFGVLLLAVAARYPNDNWFVFNKGEGEEEGGAAKEATPAYFLALQGNY